MEGAKIGYTGYCGSIDFLGYTGGCYYYSREKDADILGYWRCTSLEYNGYNPKLSYTGYTGAVDYNYTQHDVLKGYSVGDEILIYNEKSKKEKKYIVKKKHPWFLAIKKKGWFTFTRIIYRNNISKVGHLLIEK